MERLNPLLVAFTILLTRLKVTGGCSSIGGSVDPRIIVGAYAHCCHLIKGRAPYLLVSFVVNRIGISLNYF